MTLLGATPTLPATVLPHPWRLPERGLTVFHGAGEAARLSHYFLPSVFREGRRVLYLDGANRIDPLLLARLARRRGSPPSDFNRRLQVARAFTCFQLTELLARVPRALQRFPADVVIVTALPELYFDEDVREFDARVSFERSLGALRRLARGPLALAVFSDAGSFSTPRKGFFRRLCAVADRVWRLPARPDAPPALTPESAPPPLPE